MGEEDVAERFARNGAGNPVRDAATEDCTNEVRGAATVAFSLTVGPVEKTREVGLMLGSKTTWEALDASETDGLVEAEVDGTNEDGAVDEVESDGAEEFSVCAAVLSAASGFFAAPSRFTRITLVLGVRVP